MELSDKELLNYAVEQGIIDADAIRKMVEMNERKRYIDMHQGRIWFGIHTFKERTLNKKLLISEDEVAILDVLLERAENAEYGRIFNWDEPYGISFKELRKQVDIIKYGKDYVDQKEREEIKQRLEDWK